VNNQEAFTTVAKHLLAQNARSVSIFDYGSCLYRGEDGRKCAIGCLIPDNLYEEDMEDKPVVQLCADFSSLVQLFEGVTTELLEDLQIIHDREEISDWEKVLRETAAKFNLKWELESE
jgi:hypothetical protein